MTHVAQHTIYCRSLRPSCVCVAGLRNNSAEPIDRQKEQQQQQHHRGVMHSRPSPIISEPTDHLRPQCRFEPVNPIATDTIHATHIIIRLPLTAKRVNQKLFPISLRLPSLLSSASSLVRQFLFRPPPLPPLAGDGGNLRRVKSLRHHHCGEEPGQLLLPLGDDVRGAGEPGAGAVFYPGSLGHWS